MRALLASLALLSARLDSTVLGRWPFVARSGDIGPHRDDLDDAGVCDEAWGCADNLRDDQDDGANPGETQGGDPSSAAGSSSCGHKKK